jgi:lipoate-protein ligase A
LLFDVDLEKMVELLSPNAKKLESKGIKSIRSRVCNISSYLKTPMSVNEFKEKLSLFMVKNGGIIRSLPNELINKVNELILSKYSN